MILVNWRHLQSKLLRAVNSPAVDERVKLTDWPRNGPTGNRRMDAEINTNRRVSASVRAANAPQPPHPNRCAKPWVRLSDFVRGGTPSFKLFVHLPRYASIDEATSPCRGSGAGTMGSRIAAHFANAGYPVDLLDIVLPDQPKRNAAALAGIENAAKQRPAGFFTDSGKSLISPG